MSASDPAPDASATDRSAGDGGETQHVTPTSRLQPSIGWLWIGLATVLGWPVTSHVPFRNLDRSWQYAMSAIHGIEPGFGDPVVFNYGPLGFVANPMVGTGGRFVVGTALLVVLVAGTASLLYATLRLRSVSPNVAGAVTAILMLASPTDQPVEVGVVAGVVYVVVRITSRAAPRFTLLEWVVMSVIVVALTMIKVSVGPALAVALLLASATAGRQAVTGVIGGAAASTVAMWLVTGQSIGNLPDWLRGAAQISIGHVSAMSKSDPDRNWQYVTIAVVVVGAVAVVAPTVVRFIRANRRDEWFATAAALAIAAFLAWFLFRQGFTRHAARSRLTFLSATWMIAVLMPWRQLTPTRRIASVGIAAVALVSFVAADGRALTTILDPTDPAAEFARSGAYTVDTSRRAAVERSARETARADYAIPQQILDRIGRAPVHVDGTEIVATWAYDLSWEPMPSLQRYLGYTVGLDERNAAWLDSDEAPTYVVREFGGTIDGRLPSAESPTFQVELFCRYQPIDTAPDWQLLERRADRCGDPVEVWSQRVAGDEVVTLPDVGADAALLVAYEPDTGVLDAVASALFKPLGHPTMTIDGQPWRVLPGTSASPALIGVPDGSAWSWQVGISASKPVELSVDRPGRLRVLALPVTP